MYIEYTGFDHEPFSFTYELLIECRSSIILRIYLSMWRWFLSRECSFRDFTSYKTLDFDHFRSMQLNDIRTRVQHILHAIVRHIIKERLFSCDNIFKHLKLIRMLVQKLKFIHLMSSEN